MFVPVLLDNAQRLLTMSYAVETSGTLSKVEKCALKYLRAFLCKAPQVIVQSRCGEKKNVFIKPSSSEVVSYFCVCMYVYMHVLRSGLGF